MRSSGTLSVAAWDGTSGGELRLLVQGELQVEAGGRIDLSRLGYRGGVGAFATISHQGESSLGTGAASIEANGRRRGWFGTTDGGGGGHGAAARCKLEAQYLCSTEPRGDGRWYLWD